MSATKRLFEFIEAMEEAVDEVNINGLKYLREFSLMVADKAIRVDAALQKGNEIIALFEIKVRGEFNDNEFYQFFPHTGGNVRFLVLTNTSLHSVLDTRTNNISQFRSELELVKYITRPIALFEIEDLKKEVAIEIERTVIEFLESLPLNHPMSKKQMRLSNHFAHERILANLVFDADGQYFKFNESINDLNSYENQLFELLIDDLPENTKIYRYTQLETVFATINYKSIRLNGIVGMNDISEVGYVDSYLDGSYIPLHSPIDVADINHRFILCGSTLEDDLTQWRLYGDDCKGGCLVFNVKNNSRVPGVQLRKINYGVQKGEENYHAELELIKMIIDNVKINKRQSLQLKALKIWKHFFKSFEYSSENEIRLLVMLTSSEEVKGAAINMGRLNSLQKQWCLTYSHKIINPYITIDLADQDLPIELFNIILGAKCSERLLNQKQMEQLLRDKLLHSVNVGLSNISNYR